MTDDENKKGFSGLSSLASDVDETIGESTRRNGQQEKSVAEGQGEDEQHQHPREAAPTHRPTPPPQSEPEVVGSGTSRTPASNSSGVKWFWGLVVGVGVLIWLFNPERDDSGRSSTQRTYTQPSSSPSYAPQPTPTRQTGLDFSKPPVGQDNVLSVAQIRWCLRENIRIEILRPMPTTNAQIEQFNAVVADYNSRCVSFRYRRGALERARREVDQQRAQIVASVSPPWQRGSPAPRSNSASSKVNQPVIPSESPAERIRREGVEKIGGADLVYHIQILLSSQGFDPGPIDGIFGPATKHALEQYGKRHKLPDTTEPSQEILKALLSTSETMTLQDVQDRLDRNAAMSLEQQEEAERQRQLEAERQRKVEEERRRQEEAERQLRQATTSLREQQREAKPAAEAAADERPTKWFGLANGTSADDMRLVETNKVPIVPGQNFGWFIWVGETNEAVLWKEEYFVPEAPASWEVGAEDQPYVIVSEDGRLVTTRRSTVPNDGYISNFWTVAEGDPPGAHRIVVTVEGHVEAFDFELVEPHSTD